jgi:spore coat protein U-like protein
VNRLRFFPGSLLAAAFLLGPASLAYGAASCNFQARGMSLGFLNLNPSVGSNVTVSAVAATLNADKWGGCSKVAMTMTADNGLNFSGSRRMKNGSAFIPYSLTLPASGTGPTGNGYVAFTLTGTVLGADYKDAPAGTYTDSVQLTVSP